MGLGERILGFVTAPFVGSRFDHDDYRNRNSSGTADASNERPSVTFGQAVPQQMVPITKLLSIADGGTFLEREKGTYREIPPRALSAQTRLKNMTWELPSDKWTINPEGPAYILRVPALPGTIYNLPTVTNFTTQPEFLQPLANLEIQAQVSLMDQFRAAVFGTALTQQQQQQQLDQANMFPSIFGGNVSVPQNFSTISGAQ